MKKNNTVKSENTANPVSTVIYKIEQAIKEYRRLSQKNINAAGIEITVDQGLVLLILHRWKDLSQVEIGKMIFKDNASITRILKLMVVKGYIIKEIDKKDRRRSSWQITAAGEQTITKLKPVIAMNRQIALSHLDESKIQMLGHSLQQIIENCQE